MNKKKQIISSGFTFFAILSVFGVTVTLWLLYIQLPYDKIPSTDSIIAMAGFYAALLGVAVVAASHDSVEYNWNQRVLASVAIDTLMLTLVSLFTIALFPHLSLVPLLLGILGISTCDIFIRQAMIRKAEG